jgi:hypothetical protein
MKRLHGARAERKISRGVTFGRFLEAGVLVAATVAFLAVDATAVDPVRREPTIRQEPLERDARDVEKRGAREMLESLYRRAGESEKLDLKIT